MEDNNKFKNKKQPELTENQTVWKFNNQGVKEEILTQTSRRGGDRQLGQRGLTAREQLEDQEGKMAAGGVGGLTFACG